MVFSSLIFIYIFLPINLLCYAVISDIRKKNICVLIFSLMFYAWSSPKYLVVLMIMALINYICALQIEKYIDTSKAKLWLAADVTISLMVLAYFKYLGFICEISKNLTGVPDAIPQIVLPVGISFYTFQLISYVVDVFRKDVEAEKKYTNVLLYTALFHQCIAGPIVRFKDIANDLKERKTGINDMNDGISRFCTGLAKKTLLANTCASIMDTILPENLASINQATVVAAWFGSLLFCLQIYLDFSAYSDMAIGLGKMTGFHYKENFNYPYTATSITDFWRRWHISLGTFFRDYLYIPLGGNRLGLLRQIFNMFVVWGLTGLWHGASYNFILWGLYFFVFLVVEKAFLLKIFKKMPALLEGIIGRVYTVVVVFFGWVIFRFSDMNMVIATLKAMFGVNGNRFTSMETNIVILNNIFFVIVALVACTPVVKLISSKLRQAGIKNSIIFNYVYNILNVALPVVMLILSTIALIGNSYNPFIYFRF